MSAPEQPSPEPDVPAEPEEPSQRESRRARQTLLPPPRTVPRRALLRVISGPHRGQGFEIGDELPRSIGRGPGANLPLTRDLLVSRRHCQVRQVGDRLLIQNQDSLNGVRIYSSSGHVEAELTGRQCHGIASGAEFLVGRTRFRLSWCGGAGPPAMLPRIPGYRVQQKIGEGAVGVVYRGVDGHGRVVAIKTFKHSGEPGAPGCKNFFRECRITSRLAHPNIPKLLDLGSGQDCLFLVYEHVAGEPLSRLARHHQGRVPWTTLLPIALQTSNALGYLHQRWGCVHRDVSPRNVLIQRVDTGWVAKLIDFSHARAPGLGVEGNFSVPSGIPLYWPREQVTHYAELGPPSDVFALAAVLYELLSGSLIRDGMKQVIGQALAARRAPTRSDFEHLLCTTRVRPLGSRVAELPAELAHVIDRALGEIDLLPKGLPALGLLRYPDAAEFAEALARASGQRGSRTLTPWDPAR